MDGLLPALEYSQCAGISLSEPRSFEISKSKWLLSPKQPNLSQVQLFGQETEQPQMNKKSCEGDCRVDARAPTNSGAMLGPACHVEAHHHAALAF